MSTRAPHQPALLTEGPLLDQLEAAFAALAWEIPAGALGNGHPATAVVPRELRTWLLRRDTSYETRDAIWAGIVACARAPDGQPYRFAAIGCAMFGLRGYGHRLRVYDRLDIPDIEADLVCGFLTRLATIDTTRQNIAGRLIDSAIGHAARRYAALRARPRPTDTTARPALRPHRSPPSDLEAVLRDAAADLARTGTTIAPVDLELICRTRLESRTLVEAAAELGLALDTAYKRRQRAEQRLATHHRLTRGWRRHTPPQPLPP